MSLTARDVMQGVVQTVDPDLSLADLGKALLAERVSGFPVVGAGQLVGVVSRSDVVRMLTLERSYAEQISEYHRDLSGFETESALESLAAIAERVGVRMDGLHVRDAMVRAVVSVAPDAPLRDVARTLVERRIHRLPVVEEERLVGIVTTLDLVRLFADERVPGS